MIRIPTFVLEGKKLARVILSIRPPDPSEPQKTASLMKRAYESGVWCFDIPSKKHLDSFKELTSLTEDERLTGLPHLKLEEGASFLGVPLHRVESRVIATVKRSLFTPDITRNLKESGVSNSAFFSPASPSSEVFTQKEVDRIVFDPSRFNRALSSFDPRIFPFLLVGGRYGDCLLALGRVELLKEMVLKVREKGFIPIVSGLWATFFLPKAKALDAAAYAVPINQKWGLFDHTQACNLIKKFEKPLISLNPLADGELLEDPVAAFSFLYGELKIHAAIAEVSSDGEIQKLTEAMEKFPSLRPHRET